MIRKSTINRTLEVMFIFYGMWPGTSYVLLCRMAWIIINVLVLFYHYRYFLTHFGTDDLFNLMDCLSSFLAYFKMLSKLIVFWLNQE